MSGCLNCAHINLDCLPRLEWLIISTNYLYNSYVYNDNGSRNFGCPSFLYLNQENLRVLDVSIYEKPDEVSTPLPGFQHEKLLVLNISCRKWTLGKDWLSGFPSLKRLKLEITHREETSFDTLPDVSVLSKSLETLCLRKNKINGLIECCSSPLSNLEYIDLSYNHIFLDNLDVFLGFDGLSNLDIRNNEIESIHPDAFRGLVNLKTLDLSSNKLAYLNPDVFVHLPNLEYLNLSRNRLFSHQNQPMFVHLSRLKTLDMYWNSSKTSHELFTLPEDFLSGLDSLEVLIFSSNKLNGLNPGMLKSLSKLKELDLSDNKIEEFPDEIFTNTARSLEKIDLTDNRFTSEKAEQIKIKFSKFPIKLNI